VGTGDGKFVLRRAREDPGTLCIGMDPVAENLAESAGRAGRKPTRGGVSNALYVVSSLEDPPELLRGAANELTVLFPWAALLRGLAAPDPTLLSNLAGLAAPGCVLHCLLNASVFDQQDYAQRLELPEVDEETVDQRLAPAYAEVGLIIEEAHRLTEGDLPFRTSWGQRLTLGSRRQTLVLKARKEP
jgi:16S rRNA (adenine(1408)-N(1))-methyltransferase